MGKLLPGAGIGALLLFTCTVNATNVYRCVDPSGHVTFTQQGCEASQISRRQDAFNPTPGSGKATPMAEPTYKRNKQLSNEPEASLTVVGEQQDGCGNLLTSQARRKAILEQQIRAGMTRADVESALGRPDVVTSTNGQTRYRYTPRKGRSLSVSFDEHGCVRGKK